MNRSPLEALGRRALLVRGLAMAALVGLMVVLLVGLIPGAGRRLEHASPAWIVAGVVLELGSLAAYAALFHGIFSGRGYPLGLARSSQIGLGELGAYAVVPSGLGGPALRVWALARCGMPFAEMMVRTVVHAPILNLPYVVAALVLGVSVVCGVGPGHAPTLVALAPLGVVIVTVAVVAGATLYARARPARVRGRWQQWGREAIESVPEGLRRLPGYLARPGLTLAATAFWAGDCGVLVLAVHAVGGSAPVLVVVLAYMLGQLGNTLPLPGGVGGVEPLMLGVLTASGVGAGVGGSAVILYRLISLGLQGTVGSTAAAALLLGLRGSD